MNYQSVQTIEEVEETVSSILREFRQGKISREEIDEYIHNGLGQDFLHNTVQGHGYRKPYGYAGDFLMIDYIYTFKRSEDPRYRQWDEYFHRQSAPQAVRNRKDYFKKNISRKLQKGELLNIASGPARDLYEFYRENPRTEVRTTCIELDSNAINYAKELNFRYLTKINFIHKNIFRYFADKKFDIIWSAGLFDYFTENAFICLLQRFKDWLKEDGEVIIGNFNEDHNPSRDYMELFGDWYLHHRTEEELIQLALEAGYDRDKISVGSEPENVNLFLHLKI